ncbi:MAG: polysaccharide deacetylase family protein [Magnetococcales bacterium]|nr:polysaccharide deacetylase family protein [Magnetococcales bacterium]
MESQRPVHLPPRERPVLCVVVDTEEEFDWAAPLDRGVVGVAALAGLPAFQELCEIYGVRPLYMVDWPVVEGPEACQDLVVWVREGRADIGAHLHPWVNPPHEEPVTRFNSYPGNLPRELEREKLLRLTARITRRFGRSPVCYKAGRYGRGPHTTELLLQLGYEVDASPAPPFDFSTDGGPDYSATDCRPHWLGSDDHLLALPTTGAFIGLLAGAGRVLHRVATVPSGRRLRLPGIMARLGLLERLRLSPEGHSFTDLIRLARFLVQRGITVMTLSFHSPSLVPGHTPYVHTPEQRERFLQVLESFFDFFLRDLNGVMITPPELRQLLKQSPADHPE